MIPYPPTTVRTSSKDVSSAGTVFLSVNHISTATQEACVDGSPPTNHAARSIDLSSVGSFSCPDHARSGTQTVAVGAGSSLASPHRPRATGAGSPVVPQHCRGTHTTPGNDRTFSVRSNNLRSPNHQYLAEHPSTAQA